MVEAGLYMAAKYAASALVNRLYGEEIQHWKCRDTSRRKDNTSHSSANGNTYSHGVMLCCGAAVSKL